MSLVTQGNTPLTSEYRLMQSYKARLSDKGTEAKHQRELGLQYHNVKSESRSFKNITSCFLEIERVSHVNGEGIASMGGLPGGWTNQGMY